MADYVARREPSGWAIGFAAFAGTMMIIVGFFHAAVGLSALFTKGILVSTPNYVFSFNTTTWGWAHLILGVIVLLAGFGVFSGAVWARTVGVILIAISAIANFLFLPYQPIWSVLIIAVDIAAIWALTAHGRDVTMD